jgi:hypothetical protein
VLPSLTEPLQVDSRLPVIRNTSLEPYIVGGSTATGNVLFFAAGDAAVSFTVTVSTEVYSFSSNTYRFLCYYLSANTRTPLITAPSYSVVKWESAAYVDHSYLRTMSPERQSAAVQWLYTHGYRYAWSSLATNPAVAFFRLNNDGSIVAEPDHELQRASSDILTRALTGRFVGGFRFGIAPNSSLWQKATYRIPQYGVAENTFPAGFEVTVIGPALGRKVVLRSVLAAEGAMPSIIIDDQLSVSSVRDVW